ncbi:MAG: DUF4921 family protein [Candidatus Bathyarchaeia archaeon]
MIRKGYLLNRWTIIASERARRPTDFIVTRKKRTEKGPCPFCPGNERLTPQAVLAYLPSRRGIVRHRDSDGERATGWLIRAIPNLYPALLPSNKFEVKTHGLYTRGTATGYHEVLIESPNHDEHPGTARIDQLSLVIRGYIDRLKEFARSPVVRYVSIFRNHGREAGASLSHAHSQIIATPMVPAMIEAEVAAFRKYHKDRGRCIFCDIIRCEAKGSRLIFENEHYIAFTPWASVCPFEFWLLPKGHMACMSELTDSRDIRSLAYSLRKCFGGLRRLLNDPPYCSGFHIAPVEEESYHWHLEVYPKLSQLGGFEKSTGMFINTMSPEDAAQSLREAVKRELVSR